MVGQFFHLGVFQVAGAEAQHGEEDAAFGLLLDQLHQFVVLGDAHVQVAVGGQDDSIGALFDKMLGSLLVGQLDAGRTVRGTAGREGVDGVQNRLLVLAVGRFELQAGVSGVGHDGHSIVLGELINQERHRLLHQWQLVLAAHRAGDVQQEDQVAGAPLIAFDLAPLEPHANQSMLGLPRALGHLHVDREGHLVVGLWVVVAEVVDHLLDPHRIGRRQPTLAQETPYVGVRCRIDVDGESGKRIGVGREELVFGNLVVLLGAGNVVPPSQGFIETV